MKQLMSVIKFTGAMGLVVVGGECWAGCTIVSPVTQTAGGIPTTLIVSSSMAVGSPINGEISVSDSSYASHLTCTGSNNYTLLRLNPTWSLSTITDVYKTSIPGIGVKIREQSAYGNISALTTNLQNWYLVGNGYWLSSYLLGIKVQFYVTGAITPGEYSPEILVEAWANNSTTTSGGANYVTLKLPAITVKALSCETPNITVNLDKHDSAEFSGINSKSAAKNFNFEIKNCSSGMNSVNYTFAPAAGVTLQQVGNANQYITLDTSSTASGVGIQVLYNDGSIVPFNSKIKYTGYSKTTGGSYTIPMKARYIQTASNISGGTANSAVEFTMSYE